MGIAKHAITPVKLSEIMKLLVATYSNRATDYQVEVRDTLWGTIAHFTCLTNQCTRNWELLLVKNRIMSIKVYLTYKGEDSPLAMHREDLFAKSLMNLCLNEDKIGIDVKEAR